MVTLPERAVTALARHRDRIEGEPDPDALVFTDRGQPWRRSRFARAAWAPLLKGAGLPALGVHVLRHGHATLLLGAGVPVHTVSARLGHSNPSITLSVYSHAFEADGKAVAERVQGLLG